jgi:hypothetical protein
MQHISKKIKSEIVDLAMNKMNKKEVKKVVHDII